MIWFNYKKHTILLAFVHITIDDRYSADFLTGFSADFLPDLPAASSAPISPLQLAVLIGSIMRVWVLTRQYAHVSIGLLQSPYLSRDARVTTPHTDIMHTNNTHSNKHRDILYAAVHIPPYATRGVVELPPSCVSPRHRTCAAVAIRFGALRLNYRCWVQMINVGHCPVWNANS